MEKQTISTVTSGSIATPMDELNELIRQQASYSSLVAWVQQRTGHSYRDACLTVNRIMQQYRRQHLTSTQSGLSP
jgi:hypothetical protein